MTKYQKHLIVSSVIGLIGIPIFVLDLNNLAWEHNREIYWGMIAFAALIVGVVLFYLADKNSKS